MAEAQRSQRRTRTGRVVSDRMEKSITVAVDRQIKHSIYMASLSPKQRNTWHMMKIMMPKLVTLY